MVGVNYSIGFEVEISRNRSNGRPIPKSIGLKFNNTESYHIVEYRTSPFYIEDWRSILLLAKNIYYCQWKGLPFDVKNYQGTFTRRGESLHAHIEIDNITQENPVSYYNLVNNLLPLLGRRFEFRDTIIDRSWIDVLETPYWLFDSKFQAITINCKDITKGKEKETLELRINESLLGGWFTLLALYYLNNKEHKELLKPIFKYDLELEGMRDYEDDREVDKYYTFKSIDYQSWLDYLKQVANQIEKKAKSKIVRYFVAILPNMIAKYKKDWELAVLETLYQVRDSKFQRSIKRWTERDEKVRSGWRPKSARYYITFDH